MEMENTIKQYTQMVYLIIIVIALIVIITIIATIFISLKRKRNQKIICTNCGTKIDNDSSYCKSCGSKVIR